MQALSPQFTSHKPEPHRISSGHEFGPLQSMSQSVASEQSTPCWQALSPQLTVQAPGPHTTGPWHEPGAEQSAAQLPAVEQSKP
jgi:hypothetical protein